MVATLGHTPNLALARACWVSRAMADVRLERQLRYYFSDKNLWKDVWLVNQLGEDCTGFIAAEVIASFNRVQQITSELDLVVTSLKRIDELEVKEDSQGGCGGCPHMPT